MEREEFLAVSQINHKNVVRYYSLRENRQLMYANGSTETVHYVVQELIPGGELFDWIYATGGFSEAVCKYYMLLIL